MSLFQPTELTKEQKAANLIDGKLRMAGISMLNAYNSIRQAVYANPEMTSDEVYAAFGVNTVSGLTPAQLGQAAIAVKTLVNIFSPGTINDAVPQATITFPTSGS